MSDLKTYLARWYVDGRADLAIVSEASDDLARDVVKVKLERLGIQPDRGFEKISLKRLEPHYMQFLLLSHGGRV